MKNKLPRPVLALLLAAFLSACASGEPTLSDREASITAAALTAARTVTTVVPSPTPSPTPNTTPTVTPTGMATRSATKPPVVIGPLCDDAVYVSDVTIPDGTVIDPGDEFIKTWRMKNTGTCEWTTDYAIAFVSGNAMDGQDTALEVSVEAGEEVDISVKLAGPETPGTYTGNWRLQNASGAPFGELVFVQIVIPGEEETPTETPEATEEVPAATDTPTPTPTEETGPMETDEPATEE
ncbi:MAG: NBR1-Ig-like domain-containing protein [Anaerolineales bacterium]